MKTTIEPIVVVQNFNRSVSDVWNAIVDIKEMRKWFFENIADFKAEVGFQTQFSVESGGRNFLHLWQVTEVVPRCKVTYNWKYEGIAGDSSVTFEVSGDEMSARLTVTQQVLEDFPQDIPEFKRESGIEGWTYLINDSLRKYLQD